METITQRLKFLRSKHSSGILGLDEIEEVLRDVSGSVRAGADVRSAPFDLAAYYHLRIMAKAVKFRQAMGEMRDASTTHVMVFSPDFCQVLVPRRGIFKRLFPGKRTISACGHAGGRQEVVRRELQNQQLGRGQFIHAGTYQSYLVAAEFVALSEQEDALLEAFWEQNLSDFPMQGGISIDYCREKHSLYVYSFKEDPETGGRFNDLVGSIHDEVKIEPFNSIQRHSGVQLYLYILTSEEKGSLDEWLANHNRKREEAIRALKRGVAEGRLEGVAKEADSDLFTFMDWHDYTAEFEVDWSDFALDLCWPYLGNGSVIEEIESGLAGIHPTRVIAIDDPCARFTAVAGRKGSNLHILRQIAQESQKWSVPDGVIVPPGVLDRCIRQARLDGVVAALAASQQSGATLQEEIQGISIAKDLGDAIWNEVRKLGAEGLAVRSSSTVEDSQEHAGAGWADSYLNVPANRGAVLKNIKKVWASLYSRGFIEHRDQLEVEQKSAKMAVVIQPMLKADAYGVMMSVDPQTERPGFWIGASPKPGGVVDSEDADKWFVGPDAKYILERWPSGEQPCLSDAQVLDLSSVGMVIRDRYRRAGLAGDVDIEFAVQGNDYNVVQTRPVTTVERSDKQRNLIQTVDLSKVTGTVPAIPLNGLGASSGVGVGKLQIIEDSFGFHTVEHDVILVTHNTNNDWNHVFKQIRGVITRRGNVMSHAATNARECRIPAIVGVDDALEVLREYDGQTATLDAHSSMLYVGEITPVEIPMPMCMWLDSGRLVDLTEREAEEERARKMSLWNFLQPFGQTFETALGRWLGKPKRQYGHLQLDYYWHAWDELVDTLNRMFPNKPQIESPVRREIVDRILCFPIIENERPNFKNLLQTLDLADFERLMEERWSVFRSATDFMEALEGIDKQNVGHVVKWLVKILSWMHFAFYFHWYFDRRCLLPQLRYIDPECRYNLLELAPRCSRESSRVYQKNLLREKYIDLDVITEEIKADPTARRIFGQDSLGFIREDLLRSSKHIWEKIEDLSRKYKHGSEDLRKESDTDEYLREFAERIQGHYTITDEQLVRYCQQYIRDDSSDALQAIQSRNPQLRHLLDLYTARDTEKANSLVEEIQRQLRETAQVFEPVLKRYPQMHRVLSLARQEAALREDGHQLITRWQRKLRPLFLEIGRQAVECEILDDANDVFDLSAEELRVLVETDFSARFVGKTIQRRKDLERAEKELEAGWAKANEAQQRKYAEVLDDLCQRRQSADIPVLFLKEWHQIAENQALLLWSELTDEVIRRYQNDIMPVLAVLETQCEESRKIPARKRAKKLAAYYEEESRRVNIRVHDLRVKVNPDTSLHA